MRALGNGGSLGLAAVEVENATVSIKGNTATKLPSGNEETEVGVTQGSDSFLDGSFNHACNHFSQTVFPDLIRIGTDCSGMEAPIQATKNETGVHSCVQLRP